ncbi:sigma 54-interacting transcriptional regulator [Brevibacillus sp. H7]|uniref:sigma 54-interacting transcriptional regulator n=1 Tax=Brevibacillus sp. H7 TaxID=3349138 RepID=UPI00380FCB64
MPLLDIQETVQQIAEAVASVLKVEVEIADQHLVRIAGTGRTQPGILRTMAGEDFVYQSSLCTGEPVVITRPGEDELCRPCEHYGHCKETGEICCPIKVDGKGIGVIGLLAFDQAQRDRLFLDVHSILNFLQKIAELIATKVKEHEMYQEQQLTLKKLLVVMDDLDKAVITVDQQDRLIQLNNRARQYLRLPDSGEAADRQAKEVIRTIREADASGVTPKKVVLAVAGQRKEFIFAIKPIDLDGRTVEWVITLDDVNEVVAIAKQVGGLERANEFDRILGNSPAITQAKEVAMRVAQSDSTVLLRGESGSGKELFAQAIHRASHRRSEPFVSLNCAAIPEHLLESELFGYEEGAFTGARRGGKRGLFEAANKGTIFLDEIGDMPMQLQAKLLRVLQEKQVVRIGSAGIPISIDVRVIAATHRDLEKRVQAGLFREDLYYRLHVIPIHLPSLRERREDILALANFCLQQSASALQKQVRGFTPEAQNLLFHFDWPGNVRELANAVEYAVNMESSSLIQADNLPRKLRESVRKWPAGDKGPRSTDTSELNLKTLERQAIVQALQLVTREKKRKDEAAKLLGISRATLFRKLKEHQLTE